MQSIPPPQEPAAGFDLRNYLGMLLYHKWQVLCCLMVGLAFGVYQVVDNLPEYKATAIIKVEKKGPDLSPTPTRATLALGDSAAQQLAEELQILKSRPLLERIAQRLNQEAELLPVNSPVLEWLNWLNVPGIAAPVFEWLNRLSAPVREWLNRFSPSALKWLSQLNVPGVGLAKAAPVTLRDMQVEQEARSGVYMLVFTDAHNFVVFTEGEGESMRGSLDQRFAGWGFSMVVTGGPVEPEMRLVFRVRKPEQLISTLRQSLSAGVMKDTRLIQITATMPYPRWSREIVQTAIQEYIAFGKQQGEQLMAQSLGYIDRQLEAVLNNIDVSLNAVRNYKEQHPLITLAENTKTLIEQNASYEVQLHKIKENKITAQALLDSLRDSGSKRTTGSLFLIQSTTLGDAKLIKQIEEWMQLGEKKAGLGGKYAIPDPASREADLRAGRIQEQLVEYVSSLMTLYKKQEASLQYLLQDYEAKMRKLPALEQGLSRLTGRLKVYQDMHSYLIQRREETQIVRSTEVGYTVTIIDPTYVAAVPQPVSKKYGIPLGVVLGLIGGCVLVVLRERQDPSLNTVEAVEQSLELPVLGTIPEFESEGDVKTVDQAVVLLQKPRSSPAESYRVLRTNIQFSEPDRKIKTLLLSSATAREGKSVTAANLAVALTQTGQRILLVDSDLRRPSLHRLFHLEREPGLSEALAGLIPWRDAVRSTGLERLFVLPCGKTPPNPAELLGSERMGQLIAEWSQEYDRILFDTPPITAVTDPVILASKCDDVLLVVRSNHAPKVTVQRALLALTTVHAPVIGVLFNSIDVRRGYGYGYGYSYYYYYQRYNQGYYSEATKPQRWWHVHQPKRRRRRHSADLE